LLPARQVAGRDLGDHGVVAGQEVVRIAGELPDRGVHRPSITASWCY